MHRHSAAGSPTPRACGATSLYLAKFHLLAAITPQRQGGGGVLTCRIKEMAGTQDESRQRVRLLIRAQHGAWSSVRHHRGAGPRHRIGRISHLAPVHIATARGDPVGGARGEEHGTRSRRHLRAGKEPVRRRRVRRADRDLRDFRGKQPLSGFAQTSARAAARDRQDQALDLRAAGQDPALYRAPRARVAAGVSDGEAA